jgi:predicted  nucleic acid-binding Zn-ribbon protein
MKAPKSSSTPQVSFSPAPTDADLVALAGNGAGHGAEVGVDKIRDLLFGNQMQDYDRRFSEMEERFSQRFKDLESETTRNLSTFDSNAKKHLDSLGSQFREEKDQRAEADKENERALREQGQAMEKRIRQLSDQVSQLDSDFSDRLTRETQALHEEIKQKNMDLRSTLEKMFGELSNVKTDRNLLAGLFVEVAKCLNQDIGSKGKAGAESLRGFPANKAT